MSATIRVAKPPHSGAGWRIVSLFLFLLAGDANATLRRDESNDLIATLALLIDDDFNNVFHNVFRVLSCFCVVGINPSSSTFTMTQWIVNPYLGVFLDFSETFKVMSFLGGHSRQIFFRPDPDTAWIVTVPHWLQ